MSIIAGKVKELRKKSGLDQTEFGNLFGVSNQTVSNWESGRREPELKDLIKIADFGKVTVDYLIGRVIETERTNQEREEVIIHQAKRIMELEKENKDLRVQSEKDIALHVPAKMDKHKH